MIGCLILDGLIPVHPVAERILPLPSSTRHTDAGPQNWLKLVPIPTSDMVWETLTPDTTQRHPELPLPVAPTQPEQTLLKLIPPGILL